MRLVGFSMYGASYVKKSNREKMDYFYLLGKFNKGFCGEIKMRDFKAKSFNAVMCV